MHANLLACEEEKKPLLTQMNLCVSFESHQKTLERYMFAHMQCDRRYKDLLVQHELFIQLKYSFKVFFILFKLMGDINGENHPVSVGSGHMLLVFFSLSLQLYHAFQVSYFSEITLLVQYHSFLHTSSVNFMLIHNMLMYGLTWSECYNPFWFLRFRNGPLQSQLTMPVSNVVGASRTLACCKRRLNRTNCSHS